MPQLPDGADSPASAADLYRLIGERVLMLRHRAGLSQAALAERVGVTRTSITNLEQGTQRPPLSSLLLIAASLELPDYRSLLPSPEELAVAALRAADEGKALDHPFWAHVRDILFRTFSSPTQRVGLVRANVDSVEVWVDDFNPLRPESLIIVVRPRPQPVRGTVVAEVAARVSEVRASRGVLITSGTFEPDAVAAAAASAITLINGVAVAHLQRTLGDVRSRAQAPLAEQTPVDADPPALVMYAPAPTAGGPVISIPVSRIPAV